MNETDQRPIEELERFVVANDDLQALEERIGRFNVFDALGVSNHEIRHSNFLAWLLDPRESHGQGDLFLKAVLMDVLAQTPAADRPVSPVLLDAADLGSCDVRREWQSMDLLLVLEDPALAVVVENKVGSKESKGQLARYERLVAEAHPDIPAYHVFLTVDGSEASRPNWHSYTYGDLHRVLDRCRRMHQDAMGNDVQIVLDHYLRLLGSRFMEDEKLDELCQRIYKTHRRALDLIYERAGVGQSAVLRAVADWAGASEEYELLVSTSNEVKFAPKAWVGVLPEIAKRPTHQSLWVLLLVLMQKQQCRLWVQVVPTSDPDTRQAAIERMVDDPKEFGLKPSMRPIPPKWTQLDSHTVVRWKEEEPDPEVVLEKLQALLDKHLARYTDAVYAAGMSVKSTPA